MTGARGSLAGRRARLVGDALALLDVDEAMRAAARRSAARWLDLGTGNGVPGMPLLLALPEIEMTLVDSVARKCEFVTSVVGDLGLAARARVACARSERLAAVGSPDREAYDAVLAKAVGSAGDGGRAGGAAAGAGGRAAGLQERARGRATSGRPARPQAQPAASPLAASPPCRARPLDHSVCAVFEKVAPCPESIPRREGLARSRPLAALSARSALRRGTTCRPRRTPLARVRPALLRRLVAPDRIGASSE